MGEGIQEGALLMSWELGLWSYQDLKQQSVGRKEADGACWEQHGVSSEQKGENTDYKVIKCQRLK